MDEFSKSGQDLARDLLDWYDIHGRDLPWRRNVTAYTTWISEVMCQQTQVATVIPYFNEFINRFPTIADLSEADLDEVLQYWAGLGYYSRARNMHAAAKAVHHRGAFPETLRQLKELPGVGVYIASAVGSIAMGIDTPAVDGNLHRVLSRLYRDNGNRAHKRDIAAALLPPGRAGDFNQALMDLGAMICKPKNWECQRCPLRPYCQGFLVGDIHRFPQPTKRRRPPIRQAVCAVVKHGQHVLLARRPSHGLYGGLHDLPWVFLEGEESHRAALDRALKAANLGELAASYSLGESTLVKHTLTHMRIEQHVYTVDLSDLGPRSLTFSPEGDGLKWTTATDSEAIGISTLCAKCLSSIGY